MTTAPATVKVQITFPVAKFDLEKQVVTGIVLEPGVIDAHNHFESAETIEEASHVFMGRYRQKVDGTKLGIQHQVFGEVGFHIVESYIAPIDFVLGGEIVRKGSWVMSVKVTNVDLWNAVKDGAITGFSIGAMVTVAVDPEEG